MLSLIIVLDIKKNHQTAPLNLIELSGLQPGANVTQAKIPLIAAHPPAKMAQLLQPHPPSHLTNPDHPHLDPHIVIVQD